MRSKYPQDGDAFGDTILVTLRTPLQRCFVIMLSGAALIDRGGEPK
jgi:hypothetical protein